MAKKISAGVIIFLLFAPMFSAPYAFGAEQTPKQLIQEFYIWYITMDKGRMLAIKNNSIYRYVDTETVKNIKKSHLNDNRDKRDYFLKMLDSPLNMSGVSIITGRATSLGKDVFVVPVTITERDHTQHVVVVVKKLQNGLRIIKCMDIYHEL